MIEWEAEDIVINNKANKILAIQSNLFLLWNTHDPAKDFVLRYNSLSYSY
jgi:hypothetical protein